MGASTKVELNHVKTYLFMGWLVLISVVGCVDFKGLQVHGGCLVLFPYGSHWVHIAYYTTSIHGS
jgi:hypothetical protein